MRRGAALGAIILALCVGGCGRRGKLEPPPDPDHPFTLGTDPQPGSADAASQQPGSKTRIGTHRRPKNPPIKPPHDTFILDPLL